MAITRRQLKHVYNLGANQITFDATPFSGSLLVVSAMDRSGGTATNFTISGTGWTRQIVRTVLPLDDSQRRTLAVWWKVAGASEPTTISISTGGVNVGIIAEEFSVSAGETFSLKGFASNDDGNSDDVTSIPTGDTAPIPDSNLFICTTFGVRQFGNRVASGLSWTNGIGTPVLQDGSGQNWVVIQGVGFGVTSTGGVKNSVASWSVTATDGGSIAGILVFQTSSPPPTLAVVTETDSVLSLTAKKIATVPVNTETDTPVALSGIKVSGLSVTSESDSVLELSGTKKSVLDVVTEADTALEVTEYVVAVLDLVSEVDTTEEFAATKKSTLEVTQENDISLSFGAIKQSIIGIVTETDSTIDLGAIKKTTLDTVTEIDSTFELSSVKVSTLGVVVESDVIFELSSKKVSILDVVVETDTAIELEQVPSLELVTEIDSTFELESTKVSILDVVVEIDSTFELESTKVSTLDVVVETDSTFELESTKLSTLSVVSEVDLPLDLGEISTLTVVTETDSIFELESTKVSILGIVVEVDSIFELESTKISTLDVIVETDSAFELESTKISTLGIVSEIDSAIEVSGVPSLDVVIEIDSIFELESTKTSTLETVFEVDSVLEVSETPALVFVTETDSIFEFESTKSSILDVVSEADLALEIGDAVPEILDIVIEFETALTLEEYVDPPGIWFRSASTIPSSTFSQRTFVKPDGVREGDILLLVFSVATSETTIPILWPDGFIMKAEYVQAGLGGNLLHHVYWKRATNSEPDYYVVQIGGFFFVTSQGILAAYKGCKPYGDPIEPFVADTGYSALLTMPAITLQRDKMLNVCIADTLQPDRIFPTPDGLTKDAEAVFGKSNWSKMALYSQYHSTATQTTTKSFSVANNAWVGGQLGLISEIEIDPNSRIYEMDSYINPIPGSDIYINPTPGDDICVNLQPTEEVYIE